MHNTSENNHPFEDSADWANRFVPLPPTEFPSENIGRNRNEDMAVRGAFDPVSPITQPDLPCLQAIAGIDPFFTPTDTSSQPLSLGPVSTSAESSPLMSSSEPPTSHHNNTLASVVNSSNLDQTSGNCLHSPSVEVIGQQAEHTQTTTEMNLAAETPLCEEKSEINLMKNPNQAEPIVEVNENDFAMQVLPKTDASVVANSTNAPAEIAANESGSDELPANDRHIETASNNDIASYWSQSNVSCFVPGVTPIEAYPVCREYEEHLSLACDTGLAATNDIEPKQELQLEQVVQQEAQPENASGNVCELPPESNVCELRPESNVCELTDATPEALPEPLQIDPFENDEFESVYQVAPTQSGNQNLQAASMFRPSATASDKVESAQEAPPADSCTLNADGSTNGEVASTAAPMVEEASAAPMEAQAEPTLEEAPKFNPVFSFEPQTEPAAAVPPTEAPEPTAEVPEPAWTPLDTTQALPQRPNSDITSTPTSSHQLFDSVERSLSDLQSVNQLESRETFSPVVGALVGSSVQPLQPNAETPAAEPAFAVEPARVEDPVSDAISAVADSPYSLPQSQEQPVEQAAELEQSVTTEPHAITEPSTIENPADVHTTANLVESALASISPPVQQATPEFEPVDLTADLPAMPTGTFPSEAVPTETPSMPTEAVAEAPTQATAEAPLPPADQVLSQQATPAFEPVDFTTQFSAMPTGALPTEAVAEAPTQATAEAPLPPADQVLSQQATPAFEPVDFTTQFSAMPTGALPSETTPTETPSMPAEATAQAPTEATAPVDSQATAEVPSAVDQAPVETHAATATAPEPKRQVIEVDGNDGYDFLDLKAFDVANAIFTPGTILLDDGTNKFQITHRNLKHAVFAGDFQVELH